MSLIQVLSPNHTAGYEEILGLKSPESPLPDPREPRYVPTVLSTLGSQTDKWTALSGPLSGGLVHYDSGRLSEST